MTETGAVCGTSWKAKRSKIRMVICRALMVWGLCGARRVVAALMTLVFEFSACRSSSQGCAAIFEPQIRGGLF